MKTLAWMQGVNVISQHDLVNGYVAAVLVGASKSQALWHEDRHLGQLGLGHRLSSLFFLGIGIL